jgi:hypothetical protein
LNKNQQQAAMAHLSAGTLPQSSSNPLLQLQQQPQIAQQLHAHHPNTMPTGLNENSMVIRCFCESLSTYFLDEHRSEQSQSTATSSNSTKCS